MRLLTCFCTLLVSALSLPLTAGAKTPSGKPLAVMIAGSPSHGPGLHEYNRGVLLFAKCLQQGAAGKVEVKIHLNGEWPDAAEFAQADTILIYSDGGEKHPALQDNHLVQLAAQMKRGCGFICLHFSLEVPKEKGGSEFREWLGGFFEVDWSINPRWAANIQELPPHPIRNGVKPFTIDDELYYHMRFKDGMAGITPILSAVPPERSVRSKDSPRGGNPAVRAEVVARKAQPVAWAVERSDGGRGFGFTAGHTHSGWADDNRRKVVLNALLWTAKVEVPPNGVESTVTAVDIAANLDPKGQSAATPPSPPISNPPAPATPPKALPLGSPTQLLGPLAGDLLAAFSMDGPANGSVVFSRMRVAAKFSGTVEFGTDDGRRCASFTGKRAVLDIDPPLSIGPAYTLATWMKLPTPGNPGNVWQSLDECALIVIDGDFAAWRTKRGVREGKHVYYSSKGLTGWHHVAVTCNGTRLLFYLDGEQKGSQPITIETVIRSVGNHYKSDRQKKNCDRLDDMFVFDRELTQAEIAQVMRTRLDGHTASPP